MSVKKMVFAVILVMLAVGAATAQTYTGSVPISAIKGESVTVSGSALSQYNLASLAPQTLTITSVWNLKPSRASVQVCVYMGAAGKMTGSAGNSGVIDDTMVQTKVGASWVNIDAGNGCGMTAATTQVNSYTLSSANRVNTATDTVQVQINAAAVPAGLEADTYNGSLTVVDYVQ
ncbi:MAG TPA: hypothetical protein VMU28_06075 [Terriglobales bacterium]|nr:hypothetical protein [Terriglobales bacterium]